jgi:hypothetical protein
MSQTWNTENLRDLVVRHAKAIDPKADLELWPEALAFQCAMAKSVIEEVEKLNKIAESVACRSDGRCQYAIDHGAEGLGHCPDGKCCMPQSEATVYIQRDHLQKAQKAPFLCRVEPTQRLADFVPLYTSQLILAGAKN